VTNVGSACFDWSAGATEPWLDVTPNTGTLCPTESTLVDVCLNANADALPGGLHTDTVSFTNLSNGASETRGAELNVACSASIPFVEDFEGGSPLECYWEITGTSQYRTEVTTANGPHTGSYHLVMDDTTDDTVYSRNEVTLTVNLAGYENVVLTFWAREYSDEPHGPPTSPFENGADFDGVAISEDGHWWYEVQDLRSLTATYAELTVDLDAAIGAYGLSYGPMFKIRFNQYDDYAVTTDGIGIDDITITADLVDDLQVTPEDDFESSGIEGGPFTPASTTYRLTNTGALPLDWTAAATQPWLDVAPNTGTLEASAFTDVDVSINENANSLTAGGSPYTDTVTFTNVTSLVAQERQASLTVGALPAVPSNPDPEDGAVGVPVDTWLSWEGGGEEALGVPIASDRGHAGVVARSDSERLAIAERIAFDAAQVQDDLPTVGRYPAQAFERSQDATVEILAFIGHADTGAGGEYENTLNAIAEHFADFNVTTTTTEDPVALTGELAGMDVFLVPEQESWSQTEMATFGTNLAATLDSFVQNGGGVIVCDYTPAGGSAAFLNNAGLMASVYGASAASYSAQVAAVHPITDSVAPTFTAMNGSVVYTSVVDADVLVTDQAQGRPIVAAKEIGGGAVALLGWDYYSYNTDMARIIANAVQWCGGGASPTTYDVYFGTDPGALGLICEDTFELTCDPGLLDLATVYFWQVVAENAWGQTPGPVWSFTTMQFSVTPPEDFSSAGPEGGPFAPASITYTLTNEGLTPLSWTATKTEDWVDVVPASGALGGGEHVEVDVAINPDYANLLDDGSYSDVVTFTNTSTDGQHERNALLEVRPVATFRWDPPPDPVPSPQALDVPFGVKVTAVDSEGLTVTAFDETVDLSAFVGSGTASTIVISEIDPNTPDAVEFTNVSGAPVDISNWVISIYDDNSWPAPLAAITIPAATTAGADEVFIIEENGTAPGAYPNFYLGINIWWGTVVGVLLQDDSGNIVDFATTSDSTQISNPVAIPPSEWSGPGITWVAFGDTYQRAGDEDHNDNSDWSYVPTSMGAINAALIVPFAGGMMPIAITPTVSGSFVDGVWVGAITALETGTDVTLRAEHGSADPGDSNLFDVLPAPGVLAVTSPHDDGAFTVAEVIDVQVVFSELIVVNTAGGTPTLDLETGDVDRTIDYTGCNTDTLTFTYTVGAGDDSPDLDYTDPYALQLNGATIRDAGDTIDAVLTLSAPGTPGSLGASKDIVIDTEAPTVTAADLLTGDPTPELTGTVEDNRGIDSVNVTVNGITYPAVVTEPDWIAQVTDALPDNTYSVEAEAADMAGNVGYNTGVLTVDTSIPYVAMDPDPIITNDQTPTITGTYYAEVGVSTIEVTVNGQMYAATVTPPDTWQAQVTDPLDERIAPPWDVAVDIEDTLGRPGDTYHGALIVDLTAPTATFGPENPGRTTQDAVTFSVDFDEDVRPTFEAGDVALEGGLAGAAAVTDVSGGDPPAFLYAVTVAMSDPDDDGDIGIRVNTDVLDVAGNPYGGGSSDRYPIHNWFGFAEQPQGGKLYVADQYTFQVAASCGNSHPSYQWSWDNGQTVVPVSGNQPWYTIYYLAPAHDGTYWCDLTYDGVTYTSNTAQLSVKDHLSIVQDPVGAAKPVGDSHTFSVITEGGHEPLRYSWLRDGDVVVGNSNPLTIDPLDLFHSGEYTVTVSDDATDAATSKAAELTVMPAVPAVGAVGLAILLAASGLGGLAALRRKH